MCVNACLGGDSVEQFAQLQKHHLGGSDGVLIEKRQRNKKRQAE
jgi:hypothetical protein